MKVEMTDHFIQSFLDLPQPIQKAFGKQLGFLLKDIRHPSLRAKIVDSEKRVWQARVTQAYRFYFTAEEDLITFHDIISHP